LINFDNSKKLVFGNAQKCVFAKIHKNKEILKINEKWIDICKNEY